MKPEDYKNTKPEIKIEEYFLGNVKAWGIFQGRSGEVKRQFTAEMNGSLKVKILFLKKILIGMMEKNRQDSG